MTFTNVNDSDVVKTVRASLYVVTVGIVFIFAYAMYVAVYRDDLGIFFGVLGILSLISLASLSVGGMLGFLFGIPKTIANNSSSNNESSSLKSNTTQNNSRYRSNTNLEDMSDWLTKIIVGAGLVEIKTLISNFNDLLLGIKTQLPNIPFIMVGSGAVILGFLIIGFFSIYLLTRLFLAAAFSRAEGSLSPSAVVQAQSLIDLKLDDLSETEKDWVRKVISTYDDGSDGYILPNNFERETPEHEALRTLKSRYILRPSNGGRWVKGEKIILTPIAHQILDRIKLAVK